MEQNFQQQAATPTANSAVAGWSQPQATPVVSLAPTSPQGYPVGQMVQAQPQYQAYNQAATAMQPQYATPVQPQSNVVPFQTGGIGTAAIVPQQQGYNYPATQAYNPTQDTSLQLAREAIQALASGNRQYQPQVAPYPAQTQPTLAPTPQVPFYQAYPTTSHQIQLSSPYTYSNNSQYRQPQVSDPNAPASPEEILNLFGGNVAAAVNYLNTKGIEAEDLAALRTQQVQEAISIIQSQDEWIQRAYALLTSPSQVSDYLTELEWELNELPVIQQMKSAGYTFEQAKAELAGRMQPQQQDSTFNPNLNPANIAMQYTQQTMQGLGRQGARPNFPTIQPNYGAGGTQSIQNVPPSERWKMIDLASRNGSLRGMALTF